MSSTVTGGNSRWRRESSRDSFFSFRRTKTVTIFGQSLDFRRSLLHALAVPILSAIARLFLVSGLSFLLPGCTTMPWKKVSTDATETASTDFATPPEEIPAQPGMKIPVGTIYHVDPAGKFVLIRSSRLLQIEPGTVISVIGAQGEPVASVEVSPARKGQFLTADILSGLPAAGQQTIMDYVRPTPGGTAPTPGSAGADDIQVLE